MKKIVECVPNISEGRNPDIYNAVAKACEKISGVKLLDVDPGYATNRTVITFAGPAEVIADAAFEVIKLSKELIDMRNHKGEHPRMGATDVCPFIPISGISMEDCAEIARKLAKRVGEELGVWTYLYEFAATKSEWKALPNVRKGEYEGLKDREGREEWRPDFGPTQLDPKFGAIAIGARKFLVAYNINLNATNKKWAQDIAFNIRESGRSKRESYPDGEIMRTSNGTPINVPGLFKHCKSTAWIIPEYNRAQVTMNLTDTDVTPLHIVYDEVCRQATERGTRVTGSEIVGLVPLQVLLDAGAYFLKKQGFSSAVSERELVNSAIISLGLSDVAPFNPHDKVIEYRFKSSKDKLVSKTIDDFSDTLASDAPAPGGGSVAALSGAMAASLAAMVTNLTHGKIRFKDQWDKMEELGVKGQKLKKFFLDAVDLDTESFNLIMEANKLPKESDSQKVERERAILNAKKEATRVPLSVLEKAKELVPILDVVARHGNPNCASDVGVGCHCLMTAAEGAAMNVRINLKEIEDLVFKEESLKRMEMALNYISSHLKEILAVVDKNL